MPDQDGVFEKVTECLIEALGVDDSEVTMEATLMGDLGGESIDFLDIVFRLEKSFGIKIPRGDLFPENMLNSPEYVQDGKVTEAGLKLLREKVPHGDFSEFGNNPLVSELPNLFTVGMIVNYVNDKVGAA